MVLDIYTLWQAQGGACGAHDVAVEVVDGLRHRCLVGMNGHQLLDARGAAVVQTDGEVRAALEHLGWTSEMTAHLAGEGDSLDGCVACESLRGDAVDIERPVVIIEIPGNGDGRTGAIVFFQLNQSIVYIIVIINIFIVTDSHSLSLRIGRNVVSAA